MLIKITHSGVFRSDGSAVPVGTQVEVSDNFNAWRGKYEVVSESAGKTLEVATPDHTAGNVAMQGVDTVDDDREQAVAAYRDAFGEEPHGRMKTETIWRKVEERQGGDE